MISINDILDYEIRSSWWACKMSHKWLHSLAAKWFSWKVNRKYTRYVNSLPLATKIFY